MSIHRQGRCDVSSFEIIRPLPGANFGGVVRLRGVPGAQAFIAAAEAEPDALPTALADCGGLLLVPGMQAMADAPDLLVRLSRNFGAEVEDYRETGTPLTAIHDTTPEILLVSNTPPCSRPPPRRPDPPMTELDQMLRAEGPMAVDAGLVGFRGAGVVDRPGIVAIVDLHAQHS